MQKILVADDEATILGLVKTVLTRRGYNVVTATNGLEALDLAGKEKPDVIVLDATMPGMDGFGVLEKLRASPKTKDIPVLMMTGRRTEADVRLSVSLGAQGFLAKPFQPQDLLARVKRLADAGAKPAATAGSGGSA